MKRAWTHFWSLFLVTVVSLVVTGTLRAQDGPTTSAAGTEFCIAYGALIAIGVSILKHFPFGLGKWIAAHPKVCATVLSSVAALAPLLKGSGMTISQLAVCLGAYFAGSQGMYQGVLKPIGDATGLSAYSG